MGREPYPGFFQAPSSWKPLGPSLAWVLSPHLPACPWWGGGWLLCVSQVRRGPLTCGLTQVASLLGVPIYGV